jgi:hypothetical protein
MRYLVGLLLLAPTAWAQNPETIVQRAIAAHGGAEALAKMRAVTLTSKGKANLGGPDVEGTRDAKWALPDRAVWELNFPKMKLHSTMIVSGLSGWQKINTLPAAEMPPVAYDTMVDENYAYWLATVWPLTRNELQLAAAPDATVDGQPAFGVKVSKADRAPATLYFQKSSGLLVKVAYSGREAGVPEPKELILSNHKSFEGVKLPQKIVEIKKGGPVAEWQISDYKFVDKFDPATFRKPG